MAEYSIATWTGTSCKIISYELSKLVTQKLQEGFKLHGDLKLVTMQTQKTKDGHIGNYFTLTQALVREEPPKKKQKREK